MKRINRNYVPGADVSGRGNGTDDTRRVGVAPNGVIWNWWPSRAVTFEEMCANFDERYRTDDLARMAGYRSNKLRGGQMPLWQDEQERS